MGHQIVAHEKICRRGSGDDAEPQARQSGVLQSLDRKIFVRAVKHHISGEVVGVGRLHDFIAGDRSHH